MANPYGLPDWYEYARRKNIEELANDPLDIALGALRNIASGYFSSVEKGRSEELQQQREDERWDKKRRSNEITQLLNIDPNENPYDYGDPIKNEEDFITYKSNVHNNQSMIKQGREHIPSGGVLSKEAERDMFTYGDTRLALDTSPGQVAADDLLNLEAWLLGSEGAGRSIAARHNWKGVLNVYDEELDGYILDEGDYRDLSAKGIAGTLIADGNGLYILNKNQVDKIKKNYQHWKEGFLQANPNLPTKSDLTNQIIQSNMASRKQEQDLRKANNPLAKSFDRIEVWNDFLDDGRGFVDDDDYGKRSFVTDYVDNEGNIERQSKTHEEFVKEFPTVYNWMTLTTSMESAAEQYISQDGRAAQLRLELSRLPVIEASFHQKLQDLNAINVERNELGLDVNKYKYLQDAQIVGEGRDVLLDDLYDADFGFGVMFDPQKWEELNPQEQEQYVRQAMTLESTYVNETHPNYNPKVAAFLQIYGYGTVPAGQAIGSLIEEMTNR
jgi:hypothetical protein